MEDQEFINKLQEIIEENKRLKEELKKQTEFFKLAISLNNGLNFRTITDADKNIYQDFLDNTVIIYSGNSCGGIQLMWKNKNQFVDKSELNSIFNSKSL